MQDFSVLFGGRAGDGIDSGGLIIARILNQLGYRLYIYRDYPSIIRGGHTFSIIRAGKDKIACHLNQVDFILALNQETLGLHKSRLKKDCTFIYDADQVKTNIDATCGIGLALSKILKEENAAAVMRNSCLIGGFCKAVGIKWEILESVFRKEIPKEIEINLKVARRGFDASRELTRIEKIDQPNLPVLTGNEAIGLGLLKAGLNSYIAYPMTPSSGLLHFLASVAKDFSLKVIHPESEIGVILMALGFAFCGEKVAVGTSGGGFCLMTETLSFAGMAELPVVIIVGQRTGPSTGLPTYTAQTELHFVLNAGQGEFVRFVVAPGDTEEAYYWSGMALNISWKYQIPSIILSDKTLSEEGYSFNRDLVPVLEEENPSLWERKSDYKRYLVTENGVSPLTFAPDKEAIIKVNSYEHDEFGITTENPGVTKKMQEKRLIKEKYLSQELEGYKSVNVFGNLNASVALLCWGSNKGVCQEVAQNLDLKVIMPVVLSPFPVKQFQESLKGVKKIIAVENNATGQLVRLIKTYGFNVDEKILKYDGRPFSLEELGAEVKEVVK